MNVETMNSNIQSAEQYTIRAKREAQSANQAQGSQQAIQNEARAPEVDTYDKANPVGVKAEGVYSVEHDDEGNLTVKYTQPASKSESESSAVKGSDSGGAAPVTSSTESTSSSDDDELEQLQQQKQALQQQLNRESDENVKAQLMTQLQNIEAQIIQLKMN